MKVKQLLTALLLIVITVITHKMYGMEFLGLEYLNNAHKRTYIQAFGQSTQEHDQKQMNSHQPASGQLFALYLALQEIQSEDESETVPTTPLLLYPIEIDPAQYAYEKTEDAHDQGEDETDIINNNFDEFLTTCDNDDEDCWNPNHDFPGIESSEQIAGICNTTISEAGQCEDKYAQDPLALYIGITTTEQHDEKIQKQLYIEKRQQQQNSALHMLVENSLRYPCDQCDKSFAYSSTLQDHIKSIHNKEQIACTIQGCNKSFAYPSNLKRHIQIEHNKKRYYCQFEGCTKSYICSSALSQHIKSYHIKERVTCSIEGCTESFTNSSGLSQHIKSIHNKERYQCPEQGCDKSFLSYAGKSLHIKSIHKQERVQCTVEGCNKSFTNSSGLSQHIKSIHNKERYQCPEQGCDSDFSDPRNLKRHIKSYHNK